MMIYAGIDEAGYGPMFGPFVIGCAVFALDGRGVGGPDGPSAEAGQGIAGDGLPDLWALLGEAVCRAGRDRRRRIAVNDSKKLYTPAAGLKHLERGVLAMLRWAGRSIETLDDLLEAVGREAVSRQPDLLWYGNGTEPTALPRCHEKGAIAIAAAQLDRAGRRAAVRPPALSAAVVYEHQFNRIVRATGSKAQCAWTFVSRHLDTIFREHGEHRPIVMVDRQGGRRRYRRLLQMTFPEAQLRVVDQSPLLSRYELTDGRRSMVVSFQIEAEQAHLPVALASMTAKYVRELLMDRFNRFWTRQIADLKPTAGYVTDGRRFLKQIETTVQRLGIDRDTLIRMK